MGSRYYITGVQLGMLIALANDSKEIVKQLNEIENNQFIGKIDDIDKFRIAIVENEN